MRRIVRINLEGAGCAVIEADSSDLQRRASEESFDALVINLDVRDTDVCAVVDALRQRVPTAVIAGYSILPPDEAVRRLCIDMYVEKPFDLTQFASRIWGACERVAS